MFGMDNIETVQGFVSFSGTWRALFADTVPRGSRALLKTFSHGDRQGLLIRASDILTHSFVGLSTLSTLLCNSIACDRYAARTIREVVSGIQEQEQDSRQLIY